MGPDSAQDEPFERLQQYQPPEGYKRLHWLCELIVLLCFILAFDMQTCILL